MPYWFYLAAAGEPAAVHKVLAEIEETRTPVVATVAHTVLGHADRAFELIEEAYPRTERPWDSPFTVWLRYFWPETLRPLRDDPRWEQFIAEMHTHWGLDPDGSLPEETGS